jgi:hypothetical protein
MKTFRDLFINLNGHTIEELIGKLTQQCSTPWVRAVDREKDLHAFDSQMYCFVRNADENFPKAALVLADKEDDKWYVPNIVPAESGELGIDNYNGILLDFEKSVLRPALTGMTVTTIITNDHISITDIAGKDVEKALERFSALANKSTGSSHPSDKERWFQFLVMANQKEGRITTDLVRQTLLDQGWSSDRAYELMLEYEFARDLLNYKKSH